MRLNFASGNVISLFLSVNESNTRGHRFKVKGGTLTRSEEQCFSTVKVVAI